MKRQKQHSRINTERDYIRVGSCNRCKRNEVSVVVHHPLNGKRNYTICCYCSKETWQAVGEANKENYLQWGNVTKQTRRPRERDGRHPRRHDNRGNNRGRQQ